MILIYQMAKVASRSWEVAAKSPLATENEPPVHCHYVVPRNRERIQAILDLPADRQTIYNMLLPRNILRAGASGWKQIDSARRRQQNTKIVSGMRDPVARSISIITFMADFFGHVSRPLSPRVAVSLEYVVESLQENWRWVLERREPDQTFEWLLWYLTDAFRSWFPDELGAAFGIDVLEGTFQRQDAMQRISTPETDIFIYRVEDMLPEAHGYSRLLEQASAFLETKLTSFPAVNTNSTRRSRELSAEVRRQFWLPADMLDAIYSEPIVQHFYDGDEILAFKKCWSASKLKEA
ncbi:MAG: putative capsular polysaccharide synthesis family protein [Bryobacteraceae bacterium]